MEAQELLKKRNNYEYPAVALQGCYSTPEAITFESTQEMDRYIRGLLLSENVYEKLTGYLSVIFWGFYSGQDGKVRVKRAIGRAALARDGRWRVVNGKSQRMKGIVDHGVEFVAGIIFEAEKQLKENNFAEALKTLNQLPQLQLAFSSKVCAFMEPAKCGVIDSVIVKNNPEFNFSTNGGGNVSNTKANRLRYNDYCHFLQEKSEEINGLGDEFHWRDRNGKRHAWRALDVERSMYQKGE